MITTLDQKHHSRSEKYKVVATKEIANKFKDLGFVLDSYRETKTRKIDKLGYQKHQVRLSNPSLVSLHNDIALQLIVTNSHDGSSAFKMQLGFFRFVCSNGLAVGKTFESIKVRHSGTIIEEVERAVERIVAQTKKLDDVIHKMKATTLTPIQVKEFITEAIKLRDIKSIQSIPALREEDQFDDLFTVYNKVQEALIRGGVSYTNQNDKTRRLRGMQNIDAISKINEELFDLALRYAA